MAKHNPITDRAKEREKHGEGGSTIEVPDEREWYETEKGAHTLDIIPFVVSVDDHPYVKKGELWYQKTIYVHYDVGPEERRLICPQTNKEPCPICEEHARARKDPDADKDAVGKLKAKERELFNVVDLEEKDEPIKIWEISWYNFGKLLEAELREAEEEAELGKFHLPDSGKTLKIRWAKAKVGTTTFLEADRIDFKDRKPYDDDIVEEALDLDKIVNVDSYETIQRIFLGIEEDDDEGDKRGKKDDKEDDDGDDKPSSRRRGKKDDDDDKSSRRGGKKDEDEDWEKGDKKEKDDDDGDKKSRRRRRE